MPKPKAVTLHAFLRPWCFAAAATTLLFSALAASASTAPHCNPDGNSTCTIEDVEETVLLAHSRAARMAKEEHGALSPAPRASGGKRGCQDDPQGWKDSEDHDCKKYVRDNWCTAQGGYGDGWWSWWGSFSRWSVDGIDASMACCGCGGGTATEPATACHASEVDGQVSYGLDFYFQTNSNSGCSAAACQPATALSTGISKIFTAEANGNSCSCWAASSSENADSSAKQPQAGERMFLFSKSAVSGGTCSEQTCWEWYAEVLNVFKLGNVVGSDALSSSANNPLLKQSHWTTQCEHMPEGSRHNHADGLMPVSTMVNTLMSWHAVAMAEKLLALVSIQPDPVFAQALGQQIGPKAEIPPTMRVVLGSLASSWQSMTLGTARWLLENLARLLALFTGVEETVLIDTSFNSENYFPLMVEYLLAGIMGQEPLKQWYLQQSKDGKIADGPGPNTTSYYGWQDCKDQLLALGGKIVDGTVVRQNELGVQVLNGALWPESPGGRRSIFLGATKEAHAFVRPLLAKALDNAQGAVGERCDGSTCWNAEWLRQQARDFLANHKAVEKNDLKLFNTKILHKVHLNMDISDSHAKAFIDFMNKALTVIPFPESVMGDFLFRTALNVPSVQAARAEYLKIFKPLIAAKFPHVRFDEASLALTASAFCDSLVFAGGLSVPSALSFVLAITHQKESDKWPELKGLELDDSNIEGVLWETLRLYPPVAGFPYWEKQANGKWHHHLPNVQMALLDQDIFEEPDVFKFRPIQVYTNHSIGWVDYATWPNGVSKESIAAPHSHRCPGKELSLEIMRAFLKEFVAAGPWKAKDEDIRVNAYSPSDFTLERAPADRCWTAPPECASSFYYKFTKYHGCTTVDSDKPWCSHTYFFVPGQWSECHHTSPPCGGEVEATSAMTSGGQVEAASAVTSTEKSAIDAVMQCSATEWTPNERASCVCTRANAIADASERAEHCTELTAVALEVGAPWECVLSRVSGIKVCSAYAPWWKQIRQAITESWDAFKRWGLSLVPTIRCYPTNPQPCTQFALASKSARCSEVSADTLTNDWLDMPKQLQGVFWLTEQGDSSALVSFGRTSDGAGISQGKIGKDGVYKVRVPGDRSWSYATAEAGSVTEAIDLVYEFQFDSAEDPSSAQIIPVARRVLGVSVPPWLLGFNMTLVPGGDARFPGSVIWQRHSDIFKFITVDAGTYRVVQVIDGDGKRLPAFEQFESHCTVTSSRRGSIWYHAYEMEPFTVSTVTDELDRCPALVGFIAPKTVTEAFVLSTKFGWLNLHEFINDPPFDPTVYNEFTYLNSLGVIHGALMTYGGANRPADDRICPPNVTEPLNKLIEFGSLSALEDTDSVEGSCGDKPFSKFSAPVMCGFLILTELPTSDRMGNNSGNTWENAMKDSPAGATKEDYLMSFFDPYKNRDGDPIYPAEEFDWRATFWKQPGHWDNALEVSYALDVFGTFRVREVVGEKPSHGGESAALVLKLDSLSGFKRREGFAAWGGNMYFTAEGNLLGIERNTLGGGSPEWVWADAPAAEWEYAKWVFRSTLMNAVTVIDHLWFTHLSVANPLAMSSRESLLPQHPLRRLLNAATFGTIDVNAEATHLLIGNKQVLHRASPFEDWEEVHNAAEDTILTFENYFGPFLNTTMLDGFHPRLKTAPLYADGPLLMTAISDMLEGYFGAMGADWCEAGSDRIMDQGIQDFADWFEAWFRSERQDRAILNLRWFKGDEKAEWTCGAVKKLLKCNMFGVSGFHQHVGKVADYVRNPEFIGLSWAPGEMAPRPQQAMLYALVSAATGFIGVSLDQNFEFVLQGVENAEALKQVLRKFQSDLKAIEPIIEKRNLERTVPYNRMNPAYAEISLYQ